nr:hypothetical protein [Pseudodesulfovibrio sp.]
MAVFMRPFFLKMRLWRELLLGAEAPKAFHALRGRRIFLAEPPQKEPKKLGSRVWPPNDQQQESDPIESAPLD